MPFDLKSALAPDQTAVLLIDLQRGLVGDLGVNTLLLPIVQESQLVQHAQLVADAARGAGVRVIHCVAITRADLAGSPNNAPALMAPFKHGSPVVAGSAGAEIIPELGPKPEDFVLPRLNGVSAFTGTDLDSTLRNLGVRTVVIAGVSLNLGVVGTCIEAVNFGYKVVVVADAIAGYPVEYADGVVRHTITLLGSVLPAKQIVDVWQSGESLQTM